jgi:hypothetical protein
MKGIGQKYQSFPGQSTHLTWVSGNWLWCIAGYCGRTNAFCASSLFYASAIAHSAFRDPPWRRQPRPKENCPLRMRWTSSMPAIVMAAVLNEAGHRRTVSLDRPMILLDQVVEIFVCSHFDVSPARMLTSQQPQRPTTGNVAIKGHFARHAEVPTPFGKSVPAFLELRNVTGYPSKNCRNGPP